MATERTNDVSTNTGGLVEHVKRGRLSNYGPMCSATLRVYITRCAILTQIMISVLRKSGAEKPKLSGGSAAGHARLFSSQRERLVTTMSVNIRMLIKAAGGRAAAVSGLYARDFGSKMVVIAFHRINDQLPSDGLTCSGAKFEAFCRFFRRYFKVVPLSDQVAGIRAGRPMGGTLSITFDDGYVDNFEVAAPILRKLDLPATFFIATGFIGSKVVPFWDKG